MEEALRARLKAAAAVTAIVGAHVDWGNRTGLPALSLRKISPGRAYTFEGAAALQGPRIRFSCWGRRPGEARLLARAVIDEMEAPAEVAGVEFKAAFLDNDIDMPADQQAGGSTVDLVVLDFFVWHSPSA